MINIRTVKKAIKNFNFLERVNNGFCLGPIERDSFIIKVEKVSFIGKGMGSLYVIRVRLKLHERGQMFSMKQSISSHEEYNHCVWALDIMYRAMIRALERGKEC